MIGLTFFPARASRRANADTRSARLYRSGDELSRPRRMPCWWGANRSPVDQLGQDLQTVAVWVLHPGDENARTIQIQMEAYSGAPDQWESQFESQTHGKQDGTLIKNKTPMTLITGCRRISSRSPMAAVSTRARSMRSSGRTASAASCSRRPRRRRRERGRSPERSQTGDGSSVPERSAVASSASRKSSSKIRGVFDPDRQA